MVNSVGRRVQTRLAWLMQRRCRRVRRGCLLRRRHQDERVAVCGWRRDVEDKEKEEDEEEEGWCWWR